MFTWSSSASTRSVVAEYFLQWLSCSSTSLREMFCSELIASSLLPLFHRSRLHDMCTSYSLGWLSVGAGLYFDLTDHHKLIFARWILMLSRRRRPLCCGRAWPISLPTVVHEWIRENKVDYKSSLQIWFAMEDDDCDRCNQLWTIQREFFDRYETDVGSRVDHYQESISSISSTYHSVTLHHYLQPDMMNICMLNSRCPNCYI